MNKVDSNTDMMDFLEMIGWTYGSGPHYRKADAKLKQEIRDRIKGRRKNLARKTKGLERLFSNSIWPAYIGREFKTIGELKQIIEEKGNIYSFMGYKGLSKFNKELKKYGLEPFKVGGYYAQERKLKKYGLEKAL